MSRGSIGSIIGRSYYIDQVLLETDKMHPVNTTNINEEINRLDILGWVARVTSKYLSVFMHAKMDYDESIKTCDDVKKGWYRQSLFGPWEVNLFINVIEQCKFLSVANKRIIIKKVLDHSTKTSKELFNNRYAIDVCIASEDEDTVQYLETIFDALYLKKKIRFKYITHEAPKKKCFRKDGGWYYLNPYKIYYQDDTYNILGGHDNHDNLVQYRFDRMRDVEILEEDRLPETNFFKEDANKEAVESWAYSIDNYSGDRVNLVLEIDKGDSRAIDIIADMTLEHYEAYSSNDRPDNIIIHCERNNSPTLINWLTGYVEFVEVLYPLEIREECRKRMIKMMERYM